MWLTKLAKWFEKEERQSEPTGEKVVAAGPRSPAHIKAEPAQPALSPRLLEFYRAIDLAG
jgi:hypothetical protein